MFLACLPFLFFSLVVGSGSAVVLCNFLSDNGMGVKTWGEQQEWAQKVANLFRERGSADEGPPILGAAAKKLGPLILGAAVQPAQHGSVSWLLA